MHARDGRDRQDEVTCDKTIQINITSGRSIPTPVFKTHTFHENHRLRIPQVLLHQFPKTPHEVCWTSQSPPTNSLGSMIVTETQLELDINDSDLSLSGLINQARLAVRNRRCYLPMRPY
ncbi:hypothetical protein T265_01006 [Opisthorchis viverrini]|uniref:Uncharacterized protein n=1 Tax=Opisthorchis viverrini TaxID=6198 RepID=A0A075A188_OPIVI|nr:hypothetical protein T265_01006 [Opisthorchis viverrini]KER33116.1 hypothetical protein T265_01006 [Opisthorchis viverrini]